MKQSTAFLSAMTLASAALFSQAAIAGPITNVNADVALVDNQATIEHVLTGGNAGFKFMDRYNFTLTQMGDLSATLSKGSGANKSLNLNGFTLFNANGDALGTAGAGNWALDFSQLAVGSYYLQITGELLTNAAGKYAANLVLMPAPIADVPEPASVALMLAGLGLVGLSARRRKTVAATRA